MKMLLLQEDTQTDTVKFSPTVGPHEILNKCMLLMLIKSEYLACKSHQTTTIPEICNVHLVLLYHSLSLTATHKLSSSTLCLWRRHISCPPVGKIGQVSCTGLIWRGWFFVTGRLGLCRFSNLVELDLAASGNCCQQMVTNAALFKNLLPLSMLQKIVTPPPPPLSPPSLSLCSIPSHCIATLCISCAHGCEGAVLARLRTSGETSTQLRFDW